MICAKCGTEYEGSQCPKCDGPVIRLITVIIWQEERLMRKTG